MNTIEDYVLPWVKKSEPYSAKHMDDAWSRPDLVRMMSNENLVPPSEKVIQAVTEAARQGNLYPGSGPELRQKLGERCGLSAENVILGNGSTDIINVVIETFVGPGDEVILPDPTFSMYETRVRVHGGTPVKIPTDSEYNLSMSLMLAAVSSKTKLIMVCSPNNPSGNLISAENLRALLKSGLPIFFDEAYYELQDNRITRASWIPDYPNLMVNRTFSKAFGMAGFRLGYLLCDEKVAGYINRVKIPWNVSLQTIAAALAQLEDEPDLEYKRQVIIEGREYIQSALNELPGIWAYPSQGNFVLIDAGCLGKTSAELRDMMIEKGIFIRPMSGHNLSRGFFRVTVGLPEQNRMFVRVFSTLVAEILGDHKPAAAG